VSLPSNRFECPAGDSLPLSFNMGESALARMHLSKLPSSSPFITKKMFHFNLILNTSYEFTISTLVRKILLPKTDKKTNKKTRYT